MSAAHRIAFVTSHLGTGGAERHVVITATQLRDRGHAVQVICVEGEGPLAAELRQSGVPLVDLGLGENWTRHPVAARAALSRAVETWAPDVVMLNGFSADVLGRLLPRRPGRVVTTWRHNIGHLGRVGWRDRLADLALRRRTDRWFAVSEAQRRYLNAWLRLPMKRVRVVHNAVHPLVAPPGDLRRELGLEDGTCVITCVAALREEKDHATLLQALARVDGSAALVLAGDGPCRPALEQQARELGISERVHFLGNRSDVAAVLAAGDLLVLASRTIENLPYAVLEAMSMGLPVVATRVGALDELVVDGTTGLLVAPVDPVGLAAALQRLVDAPALRADMGGAAQRRSHEEFDLDRLTGLLERHLDEALVTLGQGAR